jgi:hypothetical protein
MVLQPVSSKGVNKSKRNFFIIRMTAGKVAKAPRVVKLVFWGVNASDSGRAVKARRKHILRLTALRGGG